MAISNINNNIPSHEENGALSFVREKVVALIQALALIIVTPFALTCQAARSLYNRVSRGFERSLRGALTAYIKKAGQAWDAKTLNEKYKNAINEELKRNVHRIFTENNVKVGPRGEMKHPIITKLVKELLPKLLAPPSDSI